MTLDHVRYRLFRLRRLLLLGAVLPVLGLVLGALVAGEPALLYGSAPSLTFVLSLLVLATMLSVYPASTIEALAMSAALALVLTVLPWLAQAPGLDRFGGVGDREVIVGLLGAACWMVLSFLLVPAICALDRVQMGQSRVNSAVVTDLPASEAFRALVAAPDAAAGGRRCGALDPDGFFTVRVTHVVPDPDSFEPVEKTYEYRARILSRDGLHQVTQTVLVDDYGRVSTSVAENRFSETDLGTLCQVSEVQDHLSVLSRLTFYLTDYGTDHMLAALDLYAGRPSLTIVAQPQISLIAKIARWMNQDTTAL